MSKEAQPKNAVYNIVAFVFADPKRPSKFTMN